MSLKTMNLDAEEEAIAKEAVLHHRTSKAIYSAQAAYVRHLLSLALKTFEQHGRDASLADFIALAGDDGFDPFNNGKIIRQSDTYEAVTRIIEEAHTIGIRRVNSFSYEGQISC